MATLRELIVKFSLKADPKQVKRFGEALEGAKAAAMDLVAWGAKLAAMYTTVLGVLAANSAAAADFAEEVLRSASAFGVSTAQYQEQLFAMRALGASADDLADMYSTLAERSVQAIEGSKTYTKEFKRMGISIQDLKGKKPGELFNLYIERAAAMTDETQRAAAAAALLGDDLGRRVARGLNSAGSSFKDYVNILRAVGGVFPEEQLEKARTAQLQFRMLGATFEALRRKIGLELAPVFGKFAAKITKLISENTDVINEFVDRLRDGVARELGRLELIAKRVDNVVQTRFGGWINLAEHLGVALGGVVTAITGAKIAGAVGSLVPLFQAIAAFGVGAFAVLAAKIIALVAVIGGLLLIFEDLWVDFQGGDSLIGELIDRFNAMGGIIGGVIAWVLEMTRANFAGLMDEFSKMTGEVLPNLISIFKFLGSIFIAVGGAFLAGLVNTLILGARFMINLIRIVNVFVDILLEMVDILAGIPDKVAEGLRLLPELFSQLGNISLGDLIFGAQAVDAAEPAPSVDSLMAQELASRGYGDGTGVRGSNAAQPAASSTSTQNVNVDAKIQANSKEEGREAARGFKEGLEREGFYQGLKSNFEPRDL